MDYCILAFKITVVLILQIIVIKVVYLDGEDIYLKILKKSLESIILYKHIHWLLGLILYLLYTVLIFYLFTLKPLLIHTFIYYTALLIVDAVMLKYYKTNVFSNFIPASIFYIDVLITILSTSQPRNDVSELLRSQLPNAKSLYISSEAKSILRTKNKIIAAIFIGISTLYAIAYQLSFDNLSINIENIQANESYFCVILLPLAITSLIFGVFTMYVN